MATAQAITLASTMIGMVAILLGIFAIMWQMNSQTSRLEAKIDAQGKELRSEIQAQGKELEAKIDAQGKELQEKIDAQGKELQEKIDTQGKELQAKIDDQGKELHEKIDAQSGRVSNAELEQARLNGVNSVLMRFGHTHQPTEEEA